LQALRAQSQEAIEQLRSAHQSTVESLKAEHAAALDNQVKGLEKQIANQALELNATREDLAKAKAAHTAAVQELTAVKIQLEESRQLLSSLDKSDKDAAITRLSQDLANLREEHSALQDMLMAQNDTLRQVTNNHTTELEEAAKARAEEVTKLRNIHQEEVDALQKDRTQLSIQLSDLQGELTTLKASIDSDPLTPSRSNGNAHAHSASVTKEDLQKMHEAHNLKLYDLQAEHDRAMRALKEELETALAKADDLNQEVARKNMEIQYLEQDQEESQDQITRYVRLFGFKSFLAGLAALAVIYGLF
jgi:conserved oligomeric Golgi complex subunit 6